MNAQQFGLKLIANVSYGYTSASFSGRMPMAELADAIVQVGRHLGGGGVVGVVLDAGHCAAAHNAVLY